MFKLIIVIVALIISAIFVQACGNAAESPHQTVNTNLSYPATASPTQFTTGSYTTRIILKDIHPQLKPDLPQGSSYLGSWNFNFDDQGRFSALRGSQEMITAQYSFNSDLQTISFTGQDWQAYCPATGSNEEGIYTSYFEGHSLVLYPSSETCAFRLLLLSAHPLTFSGSPANSPNSQPANRLKSQMAGSGSSKVANNNSTSLKIANGPFSRMAYS